MSYGNTNSFINLLEMVAFDTQKAELVLNTVPSDCGACEHFPSVGASLVSQHDPSVQEPASRQYCPTYSSPPSLVDSMQSEAPISGENSAA